MYRCFLVSTMSLKGLKYEPRLSASLTNFLIFTVQVLCTKVDLNTIVYIEYRVLLIGHMVGSCEGHVVQLYTTVNYQNGNL